MTCAEVFAGRLPYTIGKKISDYPAQVLYSSGSQHPVINYSEGLLIDYRWFDAVSVHFNVSLDLYLTDVRKTLLRDTPSDLA